MINLCEIYMYLVGKYRISPIFCEPKSTQEIANKLRENLHKTQIENKGNLFAKSINFQRGETYFFSSDLVVYFNVKLPDRRH